MTTPSRSCEVACELLKATRGRWMTREAMALEVGCAQNTVSAWVDEFRRQGVLVTRQAPEKHGRRGYSPAEFTLAEDWGGMAVPMGFRT